MIIGRLLIGIRALKQQAPRCGATHKEAGTAEHTKGSAGPIPSF